MRWRIGIISLVVAITAAIFANTRSARRDVIGTPPTSPIEPSPVVMKSPEVPRPSRPSITEVTKHCFGRTYTDLDTLAAELRSLGKFDSPTVLEERWELESTEDRRMVVLRIPGESDPIRVFDIGPDGLPDRRRDFPEAGAEPERRLKGALSLGKVLRTTVTKSSTSRDGRSLIQETEDRRTVAVRWSDGRVHFDCSEEKCECIR